MIVFALVAAAFFVQNERATFRRGASDRTLALLTAVDAELRSSIGTLQALATSPSLETDDLRAFHGEVTRILKSQHAWFTINLADSSGQQRVNAVRPFGSRLPPIIERRSLDSVVRTGVATIGHVYFNSSLQQYTFAVRVPVLRNAVVKYVLTATVKPQSINALLARQGFPPDWIGVVVDGNGKFVARTIASASSVGKTASPSLRAALAASPEGWFRGTTIEGTEVYTPFNRSPFSGWTVAMGVPASAVDAAAWKTAAWTGAGILTAGLVALVLAFLLGRRIIGPIVSLAAAAKAVGRGEQTEIPQTAGVEEVADLAHALADAAEAVRARDETQGQLAAIVEASSDAIISCSLQGIIRTWNPAATRLYGYTAEETIGRHTSFLSPDKAPEQLHTLAAIARGEFVTRERRRRRKDGTIFDAALSASPIRNHAGIVTGMAAVIRDVTERKRAEALQQQSDAERRELLAVAQQARAEAESANRAKDVFIAMLGHELRNPLGAIAGAVAVLGAGADESQTERARAIIGRQVQHLARLVDDLLDVSRVTTGKVHLDRQPLNLADVVNSLTSTWRAAGRFDRHEVAVVLTPVWVEADETRIEQIVSNLLGNALKYTPAGGCIKVRLSGDDNTVTLEIADTGVGIPGATLGKVFDLFVQGERALDRAQGGLGVGLTLVRALVTMHGGTVEARSEGPGKGAVFVVRLPRVAEPSPRAAHTRSLLRHATPRRILVIEDNDDVREMLGDALAAAGHEVHRAADGPSGIEAALRLMPDVVLVDIGLPGVDGYEVAVRIRAAAGDKAIRLIALTGYGRYEDRERARVAGFDAHVVKPVDLEALSAMFQSERVVVPLPQRSAN